VTIELEEFEPGRFRVRRDRCPSCRSELPLPHIISDTMEPVEQVDGRFYTSKSEFRKVGRANGLIEIGTEKLTPKPKGVGHRKGKAARQQAIRKALERTRSP
jgi:hypothetical protein